METMVNLTLDAASNVPIYTNDFVRLNVGETGLGAHITVAFKNVANDIVGSEISLRIAGRDDEVITGGNSTIVDGKNGKFDFMWPTKLTNVSSMDQKPFFAQFILKKNGVTDVLSPFLIVVRPVVGITEGYAGTFDEVDVVIKKALSDIAGIVSNVDDKKDSVNAQLNALSSQMNKALTDKMGVMDTQAAEMLNKVTEVYQKFTTTNPYTRDEVDKKFTEYMPEIMSHYVLSSFLTEQLAIYAKLTDLAPIKSDISDLQKSDGVKTVSIGGEENKPDTNGLVQLLKLDAHGEPSLPSEMRLGFGVGTENSGNTLASIVNTIEVTSIFNITKRTMDKILLEFRPWDPIANSALPIVYSNFDIVKANRYAIAYGTNFEKGIPINLKIATPQNFETNVIIKKAGATDMPFSSCTVVPIAENEQAQITILSVTDVVGKISIEVKITQTQDRINAKNTIPIYSDFLMNIFGAITV